MFPAVFLSRGISSLCAVEILEDKVTKAYITNRSRHLLIFWHRQLLRLAVPLVTCRDVYCLGICHLFECWQARTGPKVAVLKFLFRSTNTIRNAASISLFLKGVNTNINPRIVVLLYTYLLHTQHIAVRCHHDAAYHQPRLSVACGLCPSAHRSHVN